MSLNMQVSSNQNQECTVCRGPDESPILDHDGLHAVHATCLQAWILTQTQQNHQTCPSCRVPISSVNGQPLVGQNQSAQSASGQPAAQQGGTQNQDQGGRSPRRGLHV